MSKLLWIITSIALVALLYYSWGTIDEPVDDLTTDISDETPAILNEPIFHNYHNGILKWEMSAVKAEVFNSDDRSLLYIVKGILYSLENPNEITVVILSDSCVLRAGDKSSVFKGNVRVQFADGKRLHTDRLFLNPKTESVFNHQMTRIEDLSGTITASSFSYDSKRRKLRFERPKMNIELE